MENLFKQYKVFIPYEDIAGLKEARDYGWLKILPAKPKEFLNLIRTFLGSQTDANTDQDGKFAFPSYEYIMQVSDFSKNQDITASIDFLALIGLMNYKPGNIYDETSNKYYFNGFYNPVIFKHTEYMEGIIYIIEDTRTPNENSKSDPIRFENAINELKAIRDIIANEEFFFVPPLFNPNEKIRKKNAKSAKVMEKFFAAVYAALRNSVMDRKKHNFSGELLSYLNYTANSENSANSEKPANSENLANGQENGYASGYSPSNSSSNSPSNSLNKNNNNSGDVLPILKQKIQHYVTDEYTIELLLDIAKDLPVSQTEKSVKTLELLIKCKFPKKKVRPGLLRKIVERPDPLKALEIVEAYFNSKEYKQDCKQAKREASKLPPRSHYDEIFAEINKNNLAPSTVNQTVTSSSGNDPDDLPF